MNHPSETRATSLGEEGGEKSSFVDPTARSGKQRVGVAPAWDHKEEWWQRGQNFLVVVRRWASNFEDSFEGPHRWAVYAYIYPKHPYFAAFNGPHMWQEAATAMPFHSYPSLLEYPMYEGAISAVKVGSDYHHLHDDRFTHYATKEEAREVFNDAQELHDWLAAKSAPSTALSGAQKRDEKA